MRRINDPVDAYLPGFVEEIEFIDSRRQVGQVDRTGQHPSDKRAKRVLAITATDCPIA